MAQQTFEEIVDAVKQAESRGKRYAADGKTLTTSAKGALGEMQVMPKTIRDPGFGVIPAKSSSPDEIARVGRDYLQAMLGKYGDTDKALIAYNMGPGVTDKWLASGANPEKLPAETRTYVQRVNRFLGKDVPRETTVVKKEREPLPASLPPMAQADIKSEVRASSVKPEAAARVASLGPGYQAALALSFLADTDDEEDRKTTITQEYMAKAQEEEDDRAASVAARTRQANVFADLSNTTIRSPFAQPPQPVRMKDGGEAKSLMEKFKDLTFEYQKDPIAFMRHYKVPTSPMGVGLTAGYATYKHVTGKDPLLDLQKELSQRLNPETDTGDADSMPISVGLPPVKRAEGSPEEGERLTPQQIERIAAQEAAEREAASNAAFIAQKSGIGRKAGPVSQALKSGEGYVEFAKGMTNIPQNLVGAPMDISNMIANVYGGGVEKPFMGSDYIKEGLRARGLGFTPSTDPTLAAFYGAGDLGSNLVNPAGLTRTGVRAAGAVAEKAGDAARDFQLYNRQLGVPDASYAVRNKGTPIAMSGLPFKSFVDEAEDAVNAVKVTRQGPLDVMDKPLGDWFSKKLTRYLRSDFATPDDQLVQAAEKGQLLHLAPKDFSDSASDQLLKSFLERKQPDLEYMRQTEMNTKFNMAKQPYGQRIEDLTDISAYPERVGDLTPNRVPQGMRDIVETRPETRVTDYAPGMVDNLKLNELRDKMLEVRQSNSLYGAYGQPEVKIPAEFLLPDKTLTDLNVAAASNRMARYTNWQDETRQRMATTSLRTDPRFTRAPLQDGKYLGVALPDVRQNPEVKQLVLDVGCDGGWCTRYSQNAKTYGSGFNRLHIMVTGEGKKARPVAQFAITDSGAGFEPSKRFSITEIKEKGNTADFANNPALPAIQQYIQHLDKTYGGLDYVDNLKGLRMTQLPEYPNQLYNFFNPSFTQKMDLADKFGTVENGMKAVKDKALELNKGSQFVIGDKDNLGTLFDQAISLLVPTKQLMTAEEIKAMIQKRINPSKATGGMIERHPDDNRRYM